MPTLTAGQSQDLILQPNDQYTVTIGANSEAYIDLGAGTGGSGYDSVRLISGGTDTYTVGEYGAVAEVKIRCVSGLVNYVYGAGGGVSVWEQTVFVPVRHLIVLGASIMFQLFSDETKRSDFEEQVFEQTGRKIKVYNESVPGYTAEQIAGLVDGIIAKYAALPKGSVAVLIHAGGNDVSGQRPYVPKLDPLSVFDGYQNLSGIATKIEFAGWRWVMADLSFRDYDRVSSTNEHLGSAPWNARWAQRINKERGNPLIHSDGRSFADFYTFVFNNREIILGPDGIHPSPTTGEVPFRQYIIESVVNPLVTNIAPEPLDKLTPPPATDIFPVGDSIVYSIGHSTKALAGNEQLVTSGNTLYWPDDFFIANEAKTIGGLRCPISIRSIKPFRGSNMNGNNTLAVPPNISGTVMSQSWFVGELNGIAMDDAELSIEGLPIGTYSITAAGSRGTVSTDLNRMTTITVTKGSGATLSGTFSASNPASGNIANSVTLSGISTVGGVINIRVSRESKLPNKYAYLGALEIKRIT